LEGCVVRDFCFHFLVLSLVPKVYRCLPSIMDLSLVPSGSSKATVRDEAVLARYEDGALTQLGFCVTVRDA